MNLVFVRSFVALADTGSFRGAADKLAISQPTLSQHIRKLEASLGTPLIERRHTRSRPTRQGQALLPLARGLLAAAERLTDAVGPDALVIGASGNIASYYLARALADFERAVGALPPWRLVHAPNPDLVDKLAAREVDVAVTEWRIGANGIRSQPWLSDEMVVILPPEHPLADRGALSEDEFLLLPLIGGEAGSGTGTLLRERFGTRADAMQIRVGLGSTEAVKSAVAAGLGCSLVLRGAVTQDVATGRLASAQIEGGALRKTFFVSHANDLPEPLWPRRFAAYLAANDPVSVDHRGLSVQSAS